MLVVLGIRQGKFSILLWHKAEALIVPMAHAEMHLQVIIERHNKLEAI